MTPLSGGPDLAEIIPYAVKDENREQSKPLEAPMASEGCPGVGLHFPDREQWLAAAPASWKGEAHSAHL